MKAFEYENKGYYSERVRKVYQYLECLGRVNVDMDELENLYVEFSHRIYGINWAETRDDILDEFAQWLNNYNITEGDGWFHEKI